MVKLKLQYFGHLKNWLTGKDPDAGKNWRQEEKGMTEDEMLGWHHWLYGRDFEQALGVGDEQGNLVCFSPWVCKKFDITGWQNWTECVLKAVSVLPLHFKYNNAYKPFLRLLWMFSKYMQLNCDLFERKNNVIFLINKCLTLNIMLVLCYHTLGKSFNVWSYFQKLLYFVFSCFSGSLNPIVQEGWM